jgi:hypothetical protein
MSDELNSRMGTTYGVYPCVSTLVMGNLMESRFGWVVDGFFLVGTGGGRENVRSRSVGSVSLDDTRF